MENLEIKKKNKVDFRMIINDISWLFAVEGLICFPWIVVLVPLLLF